ncbi:uncharacterized protein LOC117318174 [Pecten maximus]|uniref:uncharacterized protein LOC117318174 n=1 Tax=Pecten maximus TaxID=6579 RepID=UPI00145801A0|nr:uncharacterized protein LOC117318174 [Pecten maximus]
MTSDKSVDPNIQYKELQGVSFDNFQVKIRNTTSKIELNKTVSAIHMKTAAYFSKACTCSTYTACQDNGSQIICSHKCDVNNICSKFGDCYVDKKGTVKCRCREDSYYVYKGDTCEEKVLVFFNGKNTAIVGACAGVVVAFLLLLFIYIGARWRHKRTRKGTDEKLSDPREIQRDNYNIENVPLDGVGKTNPAYRPDQNDRHGHDDHYPADQPTTENVYEEELAYDEGRYYRVLNDPESRSKAFVYQPTNMSIPDHRTSTASKFDDLDSKPPSFYMRPEIEQRRYHEFMDTEHPYSIKRPQIMRSNVNSDGYR